MIYFYRYLYSLLWVLLLCSNIFAGESSSSSGSGEPSGPYTVVLGEEAVGKRDIYIFDEDGNLVGNLSQMTVQEALKYQDALIDAVEQAIAKVRNQYENMLDPNVRATFHIVTEKKKKDSPELEPEEPDPEPGHNSYLGRYTLGAVLLTAASLLYYYWDDLKWENIKGLFGRKKEQTFTRKDIEELRELLLNGQEQHREPQTGQKSSGQQRRRKR